jgi:hypothetical protein
MAQRERLQGVEPRLYECIEDFMPLHDEYELRHLLDSWAGLGALLWSFKKAMLGVARLDLNFIAGAWACGIGAANSVYLAMPQLLPGDPERSVFLCEQSLLTRCDKCCTTHPFCC